MKMMHSSAFYACFDLKRPNVYVDTPMNQQALGAGRDLGGGTVAPPRPPVATCLFTLSPNCGADSDS